MEEFVKLIVGTGNEGRHIRGSYPTHGDGSSEEEGTRIGHLDHVCLECLVDFSIIDELSRIMQTHFQSAAGHFLHSFDKRLNDRFYCEGSRSMVALELPFENLAVRSHGGCGETECKNTYNYCQYNEQSRNIPVFH